VLITVGAKKARGDGLGSLFIDGAGIRQLVWACVITLGCAWILVGYRGLIVIAALWLFSWGIRRYFIRRLGGISGDIIGFASELNEVFCLLLLLGLYINCDSFG
jgi:adenosylcobinamide-GDP ribazoletransferase